MLRNSFLRQKWLWVLVSALTIISFVAFFSPNQRSGAGFLSPADQVGSIDGRPVSRQEYVDTYWETQLRYRLYYGQWADDQMARQTGLMENEVRNRLLLLERMRQMNIKVSQGAVASWIIENFNPDGKGFQKEVYEQFLKTQLAPKGISASDFERFARHEVGIQHLINLTGAAGKLVTPQEAEAQFRRENEEAEAEAVFIHSSNFVSQVTIDPAAISAFFTNNLANYRVPDKVQVSYVKFPAANYMAEAEQTMAANTNLNFHIEAIYAERGTNAFLDATNTPLPPESAREKIREELRQHFALQEARKKAIQFANELFEMEENPDSLEKLAAANGLVSEVTAPFSQFEAPPNLNVPQSFTQVASRLTPDEPFAEQPVVAEDAVYMIALKNRLPSHVPPLPSIEERVTQDYVNSQALELAQEAGKELQQNFARELAEGKTFQAAAAEQKVSPVMLPPFSRKAQLLPGIPNRADVSQLVQTTFALRPSAISDFVETRTGGFIVYLKERVPVAEEKLKTELPEYTRELRQSRQFEAFAEWFRNELMSSNLDLPGGERQRTASAR
jgi:peptidyl-prolyl cis-trans isomerase D